MSQEDVTQIRAGSFPVGIIGLETVLAEMAEESGESTLKKRPLKGWRSRSWDQVPPRRQLAGWLADSASQS
ncbi:MAG TPA: hypothetical protein PK874_10160 [Desulfobacteraceae bacterium]|nr:hypothetical protein [Desulfobacteraceae bacterium]